MAAQLPEWMPYMEGELMRIRAEERERLLRISAATISGRTQRDIQHHTADRRVVAAYAKIRELAAVAQYLHSAQNPEFK